MTSEALTLDQLETVNGGEVLKTQEVQTVIWNKEALQICRGNDVLRVVQNTGALQIIVMINMQQITAFRGDIAPVNHSVPEIICISVLVHQKYRNTVHSGSLPVYPAAHKTSCAGIKYRADIHRHYSIFPPIFFEKIVCFIEKRRGEPAAVYVILKSGRNESQNAAYTSRKARAETAQTGGSDAGSRKRQDDICRVSGKSYGASGSSACGCCHGRFYPKLYSV